MIFILDTCIAPVFTCKNQIFQFKKYKPENRFSSKIMCVWFDFQDTLKELLPSWSHVRRYKEVLCFVCGQSPNAHALINDVYEKFGESCLDMLRTRQADKGDEFGEMRLAVEKQGYDDTGVFVTMYREALTGMPGHNSYLNWYVIIT